VKRRGEETIMHIPQILDVTLRDGGYVNQHSWSLPDAMRVVRAMADAGITRSEIGYFRPGRQGVDGDSSPAASCPKYYLEKLRATAADAVTLVAMAHQKDVAPERYRDLASGGVGIVRLPTPISALGGLDRHVGAIHEAGLLACVNLTRISELDADDIKKAAVAADASGADVFYLADSNGSLFPADVSRIVSMVRDIAGEIPLGFHAHDMLSLAFANSLAALEAGCEHLDASLGGLGKGGGNLCLELLVSYLSSRANADFDIAALASTSSDVVESLRARTWTATCESMVSGLLNLNLDEISSASAEGGLLQIMQRN
jgi:4-hydroxy 2-oxovalerate aldolase